MDDEPDIGEAADYILSERPKLEEDDVMAVLMTLGDPPAPGTDGVAVALVRQGHPTLSPRTIKRVLKEWREYAALATERDWKEEWDEDE
jgi:hypothetical protein